MTVKSFENITKSAHGEYDVAINGYKFTIRQLLKNVPEIASSDFKDVEKLYRALTDSNVPFAGSDLSSVDAALEGCWLRKIDSDAVDNNDVMITLHYQQSQWGIEQIFATSNLQQIDTNKDLNGDPVVLEYTYPADYGGTDPSEEEERLREATKEQGGTVSIQVPERGRTYVVRESNDPTSQAAVYEGTLNNALWFFGLAGTWLCTSITGQTDRSSFTAAPDEWVNTYVFQYRSGGWDPEAVYNDVLTGEPVPDPVDDESVVTVVSYDRTNFSNLFT